MSFDSLGNIIPNLPINGVKYQEPSAFNVSRYLEIGGLVIAGGVGVLAIIGSGGLLSPLVASLAIHTGLAISVAGAYFDTPYTTDSQSSSTSGSTTTGIKINLSNMDFTKEDTSVAKSVSSSGEPQSTLASTDGSQSVVTETPTEVKVKKKNIMMAHLLNM